MSFLVSLGEARDKPFEQTLGPAGGIPGKRRHACKKRIIRQRGQMPHLAVPRKGWENEHLATFLLSQIAFVAHPLTVADDVGSDFFCTLFEPTAQDGTQMLFPLNSFAIQVKSNRDNVNATNK